MPLGYALVLTASFSSRSYGDSLYSQDDRLNGEAKLTMGNLRRLVARRCLGEEPSVPMRIGENIEALELHMNLTGQSSVIYPALL